MATRILYIITKANWGGAQRYVYDLATAAKDAGNDVVVAYGEEGPLVSRLAGAGIRTVTIKGLSRDVGFTAELRAFSELVQILKKEHPGVVHINSSKAGGLGCLAARVAQVPHIIFTAHGWAFNESRPWWQRAIIWILSGTTVALSHETICVSEATKRDLRCFPFIQDKMLVIHNGRDISLVPREESRKSLFPNHTEGFWVGMLSELHPTKRISDAISAMGLLAEKYPDILLVVLGEGSERTRLEKQILEAGLTDRVFLLGFVPDAATRITAFDMFLHTSQSEALAYAVIEAGYASLPVVATRVGGIPEILPDDSYGLLVPPRDPKAIAAAIESLLLDRAHAAELGAHLHARIQESFSKAQMVSETLAQY